MTTSGKLLAVVWLYQLEILGGFEPRLDLNSQVRICGDEENRTLNPRLAKAVLCQLSYVPERPGHLQPTGSAQQDYRVGPGYPPAVEGLPVASSQSAASAAAAWRRRCTRNAMAPPTARSSRIFFICTIHRETASTNGSTVAQRAVRRDGTRGPPASCEDAEHTEVWAGDGRSRRGGPPPTDPAPAELGFSTAPESERRTANRRCTAMQPATKVGRGPGSHDRRPLAPDAIATNTNPSDWRRTASRPTVGGPRRT